MNQNLGPQFFRSEINHISLDLLIPAGTFYGRKLNPERSKKKKKKSLFFKQ